MRCLNILIWLFYTSLSCHAAKTNVEINYNSCDCNQTDTEGLIANLSCFVSKNAKRRSINIAFELTREVSKFDVNLCIEMPRKSTNFVLFNLTNIDGCQLLANRNQLTFMQISMSNLERFSNLPKRCPLKEKLTYYIRGYRMDMKMFPAFNFETPMKIWFSAIVEGKIILEGLIEAHTIVKTTKGNFPDIYEKWFANRSQAVVEE